MEDFQQLEQGRQDELAATVQRFWAKPPASENYRGYSRELRKFKENDFLRLLTQKDRWLEEQKKQKDNDVSQTDKPGNQGKNKTEIKEPEPEYISKSKISVNFGKSILNSEADVEEYVRAVKEAYLAEIKQGNRVQV